MSARFSIQENLPLPVDFGHSGPESVLLTTRTQKPCDHPGYSISQNHGFQTLPQAMTKAPFFACRTAFKWLHPYQGDGKNACCSRRPFNLASSPFSKMSPGFSFGIFPLKLIYLPAPQDCAIMRRLAIRNPPTKLRDHSAFVSLRCFQRDFNA